MCTKNGPNYATWYALALAQVNYSRRGGNLGPLKGGGGERG